MGTEIWKTVIVNGEPYENYQVSNWGRIMSLNYHRSGKPKLLKPSKDKYGYKTVLLYKNGKRKMFKVHRLVSETFITNPLNLPQVNHKDENKENNFVGTPENDYKDGNLEWCTNEYNHDYGTHNERVAKAMTNGKLSKIVLQLTLSGELVREWPSMMEAHRNGFNQSIIWCCCNGKYRHKSHKGYIWRYKEDYS